MIAKKFRILKHAGPRTGLTHESGPPPFSEFRLAGMMISGTPIHQNGGHRQESEEGQDRIWASWVEKDKPGANSCWCCRPFEIGFRSLIARSALKPAHSNRIWPCSVAICCRVWAFSHGPAMVSRTQAIRPRTPNSRTYLARA